MHTVQRYFEITANYNINQLYLYNNLSVLKKEYFSWTFLQRF